jgi:hypothetical protein
MESLTVFATSDATLHAQDIYTIRVEGISGIRDEDNGLGLSCGDVQY